MDETEGSLIPYREWSNEVNQIFVSQNLCSYKNDSQKKKLKIDGCNGRFTCSLRELSNKVN